MNHVAPATWLYVYGVMDQLVLVFLRNPKPYKLLYL